MTTASDQPAIEVRDLHVDYIVRGMKRPVLRGVSFAIQPGERSAWSANRAAASPPPRMRHCGTYRATAESVPARS
jgi:hypothetical protein